MHTVADEFIGLSYEVVNKCLILKFRYGIITKSVFCKHNKNITMYDFKDDPEEERTITSLGLTVISAAVRFFGFILMLFGLWIAITVMFEALELYENPKKIEQIAAYIEQGSNIDASLKNVKTSKDKNGKTASQPINSDIRVSYFFAWFVAILLLLLIARIALGAIKTGGELVLYDVQIKRFAKELAKESFRLQR